MVKEKRMNSNVNQILAEVHKVIVGKDDVM